MAPESKLPLTGMKVLELGHIVAGPAAGQILADMGADVIKVESVDGGDQVRQMPGSMTAMFHLLNRNKRSVALDLKGEGAAIFLEMASSADVVIDNFSYGAIERLGLGYDVVSKGNPGLIWLSIKGFLPGPSEAQPMLDELAQMAGGLAFMTGTGEKPMRAGASIIDIGAAAYGIIAVLAALRQRDATGQGQRIVAGLYETSVYYVAQWMATSQYSGEESVPLATMQQSSRMGFSVYQLFDTSDGNRVFIGIMSDAHWARFCRVFGPDVQLDDERFALAAGRLSNRADLTATINAVISRHTRDEAMAMLTAANVPFAPIRRPDQLGEEKHLTASGQLVATPFPNGKTGHLPKLPFRASGFDMPLRHAAPALGADTANVLAELGYSADEVAALSVRKAIGLPLAAGD